MLPHNYSPLKISTALQTSRKSGFSGRGWATGHEMPDPFSCFKRLAASLQSVFFPPPAALTVVSALQGHVILLITLSLPPLLNWPAVKTQIAPLYFIISHLMGPKWLISTASRILIRPADSSKHLLSYHDPQRRPVGGNPAPVPWEPSASQCLSVSKGTTERYVVCLHEVSPQPKSLLPPTSLNACCTFYCRGKSALFSPLSLGNRAWNECLHPKMAAQLSNLL